jgi:hypothetical protein
MALGFFFDYLAVNRPFKPDVVARPAAATPGDCLAEFSQIVDSSWYLGDTDTMASVDLDPSATTVDQKFDNCVSSCKGATQCQYITFDYATGGCFMKTAAASAEE